MEMTGAEVQLTKLWRVGTAINTGGFGSVYHATEVGPDTPAAIKFVPKGPGADRELLFESLNGAANVIPILDSGEYKDSLVLVMPIAEGNLREKISAGPIDEGEARAILTDIATALQSLSSDVVHRDLKPENVLFWEGKWCVADFGIARYAGASTEPDTRKFSMTPPYAAPEQWRGERATHATDVYAFGIIAYEMLSGCRPFLGPEFRDQHLTVTAPPLNGFNPDLAAMVAESLTKAPAARPTATRILERLAKGGSTPSPAALKLQQANATIVQAQAAVAAQRSVEQNEMERRRELFNAASQSLNLIASKLREHIFQGGSAAKFAPGRLLEVSLGAATLELEPASQANQYSGRADLGFEVIAESNIRVSKPRDRYDYDGGRHSLWFCDAEQQGVFRWYELAFTMNALTARRTVTDPFALDCNQEEAVLALSPIMHTVDVFWKPLPFDQGDEDQFVERWTEWFAQAVDGTLQIWQHHPDRNKGKYRRGKL